MARQTQMPSFNKQRHPGLSIQSWRSGQPSKAKPKSGLLPAAGAQVTESHTCSPLLAAPSGSPWVIKQAGPPHPSPVHISNSTFTVSEIWHGQDLHFLKAQNCLGKAQNCVL